MHLNKLLKIRPKYSLKNWPVFIVENQIDFSNCVEVVSYLKDLVDIPEDQSLWNEEKNRTLIRSIKRRKSWYGCLFFTMVFSSIVSFIILALSVTCIYSTDECSTSLGRHLNLAFGTGAFISAGLCLWSQKFSQDSREISFIDFLSPDLSEQQNKILVDAIKKMKRETVQLFEVVNYESLRQIPEISWKAENWFLLLTENEKDRYGIWLKGYYPKRKIFIEKPLSVNATETLEAPEAPEALDEDINVIISDALHQIIAPWDKLKKPYSRYLYSDEGRLKNFVEKMEDQKKTKFKTTWLAAMRILLERYRDYSKYLVDTYVESDFEKHFVDVFAQISDDYRKTQTDETKVKNNHYELGIAGTTKFLLGNHENIEKWIQKNIT